MSTKSDKIKEDTKAEETENKEEAIETLEIEAEPEENQEATAAEAELEEETTETSDSDLLKDAMAAANFLKERHHKKSTTPPKETKAEEKVKETRAKSGITSEEEKHFKASLDNLSISKLEEQLEAKEMQYKRLAADFDNFRRRQVTEKEDLLKFGGERVILEILPVLDNFERALASSKEATDINRVIEGIELIQKQLHDALKKQGVEPIEALDHPFDPNFHEAVQKLVNEEKPEDTVINELQKGYTLNGKVIRPSMVVVSAPS